MGLSERFQLDSSRRCCLWRSEARKPAWHPYPVAKNACPGVGGLDLLDVGEVNLFGKDEEQQTLHSNRCDLNVQHNTTEIYRFTERPLKDAHIWYTMVRNTI